MSGSRLVQLRRPVEGTERRSGQLNRADHMGQEVYLAGAGGLDID